MRVQRARSPAVQVWRFATESTGTAARIRGSGAGAKPARRHVGVRGGSRRQRSSDRLAAARSASAKPASRRTLGPAPGAAPLGRGGAGRRGAGVRGRGRRYGGRPSARTSAIFRPARATALYRRSLEDVKSACTLPAAHQGALRDHCLQAGPVPDLVPRVRRRLPENGGVRSFRTRTVSAGRTSPGARPIKMCDGPVDRCHCRLRWPGLRHACSSAAWWRRRCCGLGAGVGGRDAAGRLHRRGAGGRGAGDLADREDGPDRRRAAPFCARADGVPGGAPARAHRPGSAHAPARGSSGRAAGGGARRFGARKFLDAPVEHAEKGYTSLMRALEARGAEVKLATRGRVIDLGDGVTLRCWGRRSRSSPARTRT